MGGKGSSRSALRLLDRVTLSRAMESLTLDPMPDRLGLFVREATVELLLLWLPRLTGSCDLSTLKWVFCPCVEVLASPFG